MRSFRTTIPVSITGWTRACLFSPRHCLTDAELDGSLTAGAAEQIYPMGKRHWRGRWERSEIRGIVIQQNELAGRPIRLGTVKGAISSTTSSPPNSGHQHLYVSRGCRSIKVKRLLRSLTACLSDRLQIALLTLVVGALIGRYAPLAAIPAAAAE